MPHSKKLWRLQDLLDAAATKEEDLLAAATKARNEDAPLTFGSSTLAATWSSTEPRARRAAKKPLPSSLRAPPLCPLSSKATALDHCQSH